MLILRQILTDHRPHRGISYLEQKDAGCKDIQLRVPAEIENTLKALGLLTQSRITRPRVIDLVATNQAERDESRNA